MKKDFDKWNEQKKKVNAYELRADFFYHQREVWWCAIGLNVDVETDGKQVNFERPVLVVQKFNKEMFWGIPLTSKERTGEFYEKISHDKGIAWAMLTHANSSYESSPSTGEGLSEAEATYSEHDTQT